MYTMHAKGIELGKDKQNPTSRTFVNFSTFVENMRGVMESQPNTETVFKKWINKTTREKKIREDKKNGGTLSFHHIFLRRLFSRRLLRMNELINFSHFYAVFSSPSRSGKRTKSNYIKTTAATTWSNKIRNKPITMMAY